MSASNADFPPFDLDCVIDDTDSPTEVTVFSTATAEALSTEWITIDWDHTVPFEEIQ